ncbi:class III extradiol ring-cleavage dioxygenase family protein [Motilibacter peucedani]|uniref:hypothetical protein n=1 Tax=Motilibacter peucedani TaxID=598650 RepID=UPI001E37ECBA|nr:hypothetical protein [Motilibacter peucedani]
MPEVAAGAAQELDELRRACDRAVAEVLDAGVSRVAVVATGLSTGERSADDRADLAPYGLPLLLGRGAGPARLPLGLALGGWLLDRAGWAGPRTLWSVTSGATVDDCVRCAADLAPDADERLGVVCVGDGSARREDRSPRWPDPRAVPLDDAVEQALAAGDTAALLALDPEVCAELSVDGRAPWQVLGAMAARDGAGPPRGEVLLATAPYGVGYVVALWHGGEPRA